MHGAPAATVARTLYRSLLRVGGEFRRAGIPLLGVCSPPGSSLSFDGGGLRADAWRDVALGGAPALASELRRPRLPAEAEVHIDGGFAALRTLRRQFRVLSGADEEAGTGLLYWCGLLEETHGKLRQIPAGDRLSRSLVLAGALEDAALQLGSLASPHIRSLDVLEEEAAWDDKKDHAILELDSIAAEVRRSFPGLFSPLETGGADGQDRGARMEQIEAIGEILYSSRRFRSLPVEWVYDGLSPLLLSEVLIDPAAKRNGIPIVLAILQQAVAARLGLPSKLCQATSALAEEPEPLSRGATTLAPEPDVWLLCFPREPGSGDPSHIIVDPGKKGRILTEEACLRRFPAVRLSSAARMADAVSVWSALARAVVVAHMRRGESEAVASWLYQLLALDPTAPEWQTMMTPAELERK